MHSANNNSTSGLDARHTTSLTTGEPSIPPVEPDLHHLIRTHTDLRQIITGRLLGLLSPSTSSAVLLLSAQDQLALLHRILAERQTDLPRCAEGGADIVACSTALALADTIVFKFVLAPAASSPRVIQDAAAALEGSQQQFESASACSAGSGEGMIHAVKNNANERTV